MRKGSTHNRNKSDSTVLEFNFKNHTGAAPRRGLIFRQKFLKFKLSLTRLKGPISAGVFYVFWGLIIGGY